MNTKKISESIYITSFTASICILVYYIIVTTISFFEYNHLKANLVKLSENRSEILANPWWTKWQRPANSNEYMIIWLFNYDYMSTINFIQDIDKGNGIKMAIIEIKGPITSLNGMKQRLLNPPFGTIQMLESKTNQNEYQINIAWYSNASLSTNIQLLHPETQIKLKLHSIVKEGSKFAMKLNNEWLSNKARSQVYNNVQVVDLEHNSATICVNTPSGPRKVTLRCGEETVVNYINS